jgi:hypothetical protein
MAMAEELGAMAGFGTAGFGTATGTTVGFGTAVFGMGAGATAVGEMGVDLSIFGSKVRLGEP